MPKRTLYLIIVLFLTALGLMFIAQLTPYPKTPQPNIVAIPTPAVAQTALLFDEISMSTSSAKPLYSLPIIIQTGKNLVTGVQLELSYDPEIITNVSIQQGSFFLKPVVLLNNIDKENGRISYALGINPQDSGKKGEDIVATLNFKTNVLSPTATTISFLPKTLVTAEDVEQSVLKSTSPTQFIVGQNVRYTK